MRRREFPPLRDSDLVYMDSACMSLRPEKVIEAVESYYRDYPACPGRSHHSMSEKASENLAEARKQIADLIGSPEDRLVLNSGTTEGINTVASGFDADKVILSDREHNSNLVPWQTNGFEIEFLETENGLDLEKLDSMLSGGEIVSLVHVSNLDGMKLDVQEAARIARENGAYTMVDGAQSVPHMPVDVSEYPVDFLAFSGHKMLGPSGTGGLYVSERAEEKLVPLTYGGGAVKDSSRHSAEFLEFPESFEPGLPNVAGIVGMGEAASFLQEAGMDNVHRYEKELTETLEAGLEEIDGLRYMSKGSGVVTFWIDGMDPHQVALMLDREDIAVRSGEHCVHSWFGEEDVPPGVRASMHLYNNEEDIEDLLEQVEKISYVA